jgi:hypothetical protein
MQPKTARSAPVLSCWRFDRPTVSAEQQSNGLHDLVGWFGRLQRTHRAISVAEDAQKCRVRLRVPSTPSAHNKSRSES